jgi:hypothetical protein
VTHRTKRNFANSGSSRRAGTPPALNSWPFFTSVGATEVRKQTNKMHSVDVFDAA